MKSLFENKNDKSITIFGKIAAAMMSGVVGSLVGNPADVINIRMQADAKLPDALKRNYKHFFDGFSKIVKNEGVTSLWRGSTPNTIRAMLMTSGKSIGLKERAISIL